MNLCPSSTSRYFGIIRYVGYAVLFLFASIWTCSIGYGFHIYLFGSMIIILLTSAGCALRYQVIMELKLLNILMIGTWLMILANIYLLCRLNIVTIVCFFAILVNMQIFYIHRRLRLKWLINNTKIMTESEAEYNRD
jgi:hypothetical protein